MKSRHDTTDFPGPLSYRFMQCNLDLDGDGTLFLTAVDDTGPDALNIRMEPDTVFALLLLFRLPHVRATIAKAERQRQHARYATALRETEDERQFVIADHNRIRNELEQTKNELADLKAQLRNGTPATLNGHPPQE